MTVLEEDYRRVRAIKDALDHPIVDADGHLIESVPLLFEYVTRLGGAAAVDGLRSVMPTLFTGAGDIGRREDRGPWWPMPTDYRYQATCMAPGLLAERLDEIGIDYTILYPSVGLVLCTIPGAAIRAMAIRALNTMQSEICGPHSRRLTAAAVIPMHSPDEAIAELDHCIGELGFKVAMIPAAVARPLDAFPDAFPAACRFDRFGIDSDHDYDPLWQRFVDLGVAVTAHGGIGFRYLPAGRNSPSNYAFNHILGHADLQEGLCRALVMGGVTQRFPRLPFAFLEGGIGWAAELLQGLLSHWEKRSARGLPVYDPSKLDVEKLSELLTRYGIPPIPPEMLEREGASAALVRDEFEDAAIDSTADLARIFGEQLFFGCEAEDLGIARALDGRGNPLGVTLRPVIGSDIGHWDVQRMSDVLPESRELVDDGLLSEDGYRRFTFEYPVRLHTSLNPSFFEGTVVEDAVHDLLGGCRARSER